MVLVFAFLPLINIAFLSLLFAYAFYIQKENKKHKVNLKKIIDPFSKFYYQPETCQTIGKHYTMLNLSPNCNFYLN